MSEYMPEEVQSVMGLVDAYLIWKDKYGDPRGFERYHPSAFGRCLRLMQYQRYSERGYIPTPDDPKDPHILRVFGNGHSMHDRWRAYFDEMHVLKGIWVCTNPLCAAIRERIDLKDAWEGFRQHPEEWLKKRRVYGKDQLQGSFRPEKCECGSSRFKYEELLVESKELNMRGHADLIVDFSSPKFDPSEYIKCKKNGLSLDLLPKKPIVIDFKSINHFDYQDVAKGNPHSYYLIQLMIYANVLDCDYGILMYENKNTQKAVAFRVNKDEETLWQEVVRQATLMNEMVEVVDENGVEHHLLPPPRPDTPDSKECEWCVYRDICHESPIWSDPELMKKREEFYGKLL